MVRRLVPHVRPGLSLRGKEIRELAGGPIFLHATHGGSGRLSGAEVQSQNAYLYVVGDGKIAQVGFFVKHGRGAGGGLAAGVVRSRNRLDCRALNPRRGG